MAREFDLSVEEVGRSIAALIKGSRFMPDVADIWRAIGERRARGRLYGETKPAKRTQALAADEPLELLVRANALVVDSAMRMGLAWQRIVSRRLPEIRARLDDYRSDVDPLPEVRNRLLDEVALFLKELAEFAADEGRALQQDIELFLRRLIPEEPRLREQPRRRATKVFVLEAENRPASSTRDIARSLCLTEDMTRLRKAITGWYRTADPHVSDKLEHQFDGDAKYFRPLTVFSCHKAVTDDRIPDSLITSAQVVEMMHNVSLIIDDIVDKSKLRRGKKTLHEEYNELTAYMVAGYIVGDCYDLLARQMVDGWRDPGSRAAHDEGNASDTTPDLPDEPGPDQSQFRSRYEQTRPPGESTCAVEWLDPVRFDMRLLSELLKRLAVAECLQWDSRMDGAQSKRRWEAVSLADWYWLAREDTGSMFEICACLGARSQRFRKFGRLLGMLYHGCDDVADLFGEHAKGDAGLSGGGDEDIDEGILTLPTALAIQDERIRHLYKVGDRKDPKIKFDLLKAYNAQENAAHRELDRIEAAAKNEARAVSSAPEGLILLVQYTRGLAPRRERAQRS